MIMQIHDELVFEVRRDAVEEVGAAIRHSMESVSPSSEPLKVPLEVKISTGRHWGEI